MVHRLLLATWFMACLVGIGAMVVYEHRPAPAAAVPDRWPGDVEHVSLATDSPTLVMAIHPRCPCSEASLASLDALVRGSQPRPRTIILITIPEDGDTAWTSGKLWRQAQGVPGAVALPDPSGGLAARFGALTSGQAAIYARDGGLLFQGGLTPARGKTAPISALQGALSSLREERPAAASPVYGCGLVTPATACGESDR